MRIQKPRVEASKPDDNSMVLYVRFFRVFSDDLAYKVGVRRLMDRSGYELPRMIYTLNSKTDRGILAAALNRRVPVVLELCGNFTPLDHDASNTVTFSQQIKTVEEGLSLIKEHLPKIVKE